MLLLSMVLMWALLAPTILKKPDLTEVVGLISVTVVIVALGVMLVIVGVGRGQPPPELKPTKAEFEEMQSQRRATGKKRSRAPSEMAFSVCLRLREMGLNANMAKPGRPEEYVGGRHVWGKNSLGLIEIEGKAIRWVNVIYEMVRRGQSPERIVSSVYVVPDPAISKKSHFKSVLEKKRRQMVGIRWKSNIEGGLIWQLEQDVSLNQSLLGLEKDIEIKSYPKYGCWGMTIGTHFPSQEEWDCYETIARHLLEPSNK